MQYNKTVNERKDGTDTSDTAAKIIPAKHPWRWVGSIIALLLLVGLIKTLITNERYGWPTVWEYLFSEPILNGIGITLSLTAIATIIALVGGTLLAVMRTSNTPVLRVVSSAYIWFFRSVPLLVQIIFFYNISALYPTFAFSIPFGPSIDFGSANGLITPFVAAILGLSFNEAAYTAETVRGGLLAVDKGQIEAGRAMGFSKFRLFRLIVFPQALRVFIPPFGNQVVNLLKMTTLVSVIALADLLYAAQIIYSRTFETIPLLIVASLWYLLMVSILTYGQSILERRLSADSGRTQARRTRKAVSK